MRSEYVSVKRLVVASYEASGYVSLSEYRQSMCLFMVNAQTIANTIIT